jgi:radical SAM protein with 4Fe4S-binding SPASM domain
MSWSLYRRIVDELARTGVYEVTLHFGGESFSHPNFAEMFRYIMDRRHHFGHVSLFSNGMLFNNEKQHLLVDSGLDSIGFSIEGFAEFNDKIRLGVDYSQVERNILNFLRLKGSSKPRVFINMTDVGQTEKQLEMFLSFWLPKVDFVRFNPCLDDRFRIVDRSFFNGDAVRNNVYCSSGFSTMAILWNGDVVPCCRDLEGHNIIGNVDAYSLKTVWNGDRFANFRKSCLHNSFPQGCVCRECDAWRQVFEPNEIVKGGVRIIREGASFEWQKVSTQVENLQCCLSGEVFGCKKK